MQTFALGKKSLYRSYDLVDSHQFHAFHVDFICAVVLETGRTRNVDTKDDVLLSVRPRKRRIRRTKDANDGCADGRSHVHGTAIIRDDDGAAAVQFGEFEEVGLPGQGAAALGDYPDLLALHGGTGEYHTFTG